MTEEPTHHHLVADAVQIKLEMPAVDTKVISPEELRAGAIVQPEPWMVRHLMDHPEVMRDLSPWEFQVYMAALLEKKWGRNVELGPRGKDGGVDIKAERPGEFGPELMLVQCKHPRPGKPVGIDTVWLLHLQVIKRDARPLGHRLEVHAKRPPRDPSLEVPDGRRRRRPDPAVARGVQGKERMNGLETLRAQFPSPF